MFWAMLCLRSFSQVCSLLSGFSSFGFLVGSRTVWPGQILGEAPVFFCVFCVLWEQVFLSIYRLAYSCPSLRTNSSFYLCFNFFPRYNTGTHSFPDLTCWSVGACGGFKCEKLAIVRWGQHATHLATHLQLILVTEVVFFGNSRHGLLLRQCYCNHSSVYASQWVFFISKPELEP